MHKLWSKFSALTDKCYTDMIQESTDSRIWEEAFSVLIQIIEDERKKDPHFAPELYELEEITDYRYDISGWIEDYLDEMDMREEYQTLYDSCQKLLNLFRWVEETPSTLNFQMASALREMGRMDESLEFCEAWYQREQKDVVAAAALIYARIAEKDYKGAQEIVGTYIKEDTECTDENDIIFTAAERLYEATGDEKALERVEQSVEEYEEALEEYFTGTDDEDELPF